MSREHCTNNIISLDKQQKQCTGLNVPQKWNHKSNQQEQWYTEDNEKGQHLLKNIFPKFLSEKKISMDKVNQFHSETIYKE